MREKYGVETASPKPIFKEAFKQGIIENDGIWLAMTDMRNETSHAYNEKFADKVLIDLPQMCEALKSLLWKLEK